MQIATALGIRNSAPVFSMVPLRRAALLPTITEEDKVILSNVEKVVKFLTSETTSSLNQVYVKCQLSIFQNATIVSICIILFYF